MKNRSSIVKASNFKVEIQVDSDRIYFLTVWETGASRDTGVKRDAGVRRDTTQNNKKTLLFWLKIINKKVSRLAPVSSVLPQAGGETGQHLFIIRILYS